MKITETELKGIIEEVLLNEEVAVNPITQKAELDKLNTLGDLKKLLKKAKSKKQDEIRGGGVKDAATGMLADLIPGAGTIKDLSTAAMKAYKLPDEATAQSALSFMNVDDDMSKIVNDEIENKFIKSFIDHLEGMDDDIPLDSSKLNVNRLLSNFIASEFNERTITGFDEGKRMRITRAQLREIISEACALESMPTHSEAHTVVDIPVPEDYNAVRSFLAGNPDIVDLGLGLMMDMAGTSCERSTAQGVIDHLKEMLGVTKAHAHI